MISAARRAAHAYGRAAERMPEAMRRARIIAVRELLGLSREELAELAGIRLASLVRGESGGMVTMTVWLPIVDWCARQGLDLVGQNFDGIGSAVVRRYAR